MQALDLLPKLVSCLYRFLVMWTRLNYLTRYSSPLKWGNRTCYIGLLRRLNKIDQPWISVHILSHFFLILGSCIHLPSCPLSSPLPYPHLAPHLQQISRSPRLSALIPPTAYLRLLNLNSCSKGFSPTVLGLIPGIMLEQDQAHGPEEFKENQLSPINH